MSSTDRIVKATKHLRDAINGTPSTAPDELQAIEHLRALILGTTEQPPLPELPCQQVTPKQPPPIQELHDQHITPQQPVFNSSSSDEHPLEQQIQTNSTPSIRSSNTDLHIIPLNDNEINESTEQNNTESPT